MPQEATLAIYMPGRDFAILARELIESGVPPKTPCIAVSKATTSDQHVVGTPIEDLGSAKIGLAPVLLLIGRAIQFSKATNIFEPFEPAPHSGDDCS